MNKTNPICPYCQKPAVLVTGDAIYPHRQDLKDKYFWLCQPCNAWVGTHSNSKQHVPLGTIADAQTRRWRSNAHIVFDPIWKLRFLSRRTAYKWLAKKLNIPRQKCHISQFSVDQCKKTIKIVKTHKGEIDEIYRQKAIPRNESSHIEGNRK